MLLAQNLVLMGIFFTIPLFLQIVQGLDALDTGVRMLPTSVGLFLTALAGSALASRFAARTLVRAGLGVTFVATLLLLGTIEPELDNALLPRRDGRARGGDGPDRLPARQRGPVRGRRQRPQRGGRAQNTAQQLGSSLGTALLGAIVISGLTAAFSSNVESDPSISKRGEQTRSR